MIGIMEKVDVYLLLNCPCKIHGRHNKRARIAVGYDMPYRLLRKLFYGETGQDVAEYAVMGRQRHPLAGHAVDAAKVASVGD